MTNEELVRYTWVSGGERTMLEILLAERLGRVLDEVDEFSDGRNT
mgnify:CR=1 FL=1